MHKGRIVPHHPEFWVGWNYFWPSYISWKLMLAAMQSYRFPDFPNYGPPTPKVSNAGIVVDQHEIYWQWNVDWTVLIDLLQINVKDYIFVGGRGTQFHAQMWLEGVLVDECWWYEFAAVFEWNGTVFTAYKTPTVDSSSPWGYAQIQQATYIQGGDPWS